MSRRSRNFTLYRLAFWADARSIADAGSVAIPDVLLPISRLIISRRGAYSGRTQVVASAVLPRSAPVLARGGTPNVRGRFWRVSAAGGLEPESLRFGHSEPLLRGTAEEWEDAVHL